MTYLLMGKIIIIGTIILKIENFISISIFMSNQLIESILASLLKEKIHIINQEKGINYYQSLTIIKILTKRNLHVNY